MIMSRKSSMASSDSQKLFFFVKILKIKKCRKNDTSAEEGALALRVIRAGTRLTVHRALPYENSWIKKKRRPVKNGNLLSNIGRVDKVLLDDLEKSAQDRLWSVHR